MSNVHAYHRIKAVAMPKLDTDYKKSCDQIEVSCGLWAEYVRDMSPKEHSFCVMIFPCGRRFYFRILAIAITQCPPHLYMLISSAFWKHSFDYWDDSLMFYFLFFIPRCIYMHRHIFGWSLIELVLLLFQQNSSTRRHVLNQHAESATLASQLIWYKTRFC